MIRQTAAALYLLIACLTIVSCTAREENAATAPTASDPDYGLDTSAEVLVTSEQGARIAPARNVSFSTGQASGPSIIVRPDVVKQTIVGIGSSFTESSAFVLAHLSEQQRREVLNKVWGEDGANFSLARTVIGATDFAVTGKYSYAAVADDAKLENFSIEVDKDGFEQTEYPGIRDESFDLLPMIKEALAIKQAQQDKNLRIIASAWTAPPWMKDIETWFIRGAPENNWQGTGGALKEQYVATYADYLVRYLDAYQAEGVDIWGLTPVNEPHGNGGHWESMHFSPGTQNDFVKKHLGPRLQASDHRETKLLIYDQNRDHLEDWTDVILGDPETARYVYGVAVHWYASTFKVFEDVFERVHNKFPDFDIIHTEGTIDDLGKPAPGGIGDPERFEETGWFDNDSFWWNDNATDWAYTAVMGAECAGSSDLHAGTSLRAQHHRQSRSLGDRLD